MNLLARSPINEPVTALAGVTFSVEKGQTCAVVGPNGAGKSTLFRILTGLTTRSSGSSFTAGFDTDSGSREVRRRVGFMPADDRSLFLRQSCRENLMFHGLLHGMSRSTIESRANDVLEMVGLGHARDRAGMALSSGMRARLQLARALLHQPSVLILDEPTANVDPVAATELIAEVQQLTHDLSMATLISSHRLEEIESLGDNVVFLDKGSVVHWGPLQLLRDLWDQPVIRLEFKTDTAAAAAASNLREMGTTSIRHAESNVVEATSSSPVGELLGRLGPQLAELMSVREATLPLSAVFAKLMESQHD